MPARFDPTPDIEARAEIVSGLRVKLAMVAERLAADIAAERAPEALAARLVEHGWTVERPASGVSGEVRAIRVERPAG